MGCHNDAFLNNWGNDGTYASNDEDDDPAVRRYVAAETRFVPNGGETNVESNSRAERVYANAPAEMSLYHWSFCGSSYATQVTGRWRSSGIFDTLNIHMGYRYTMMDGIFTDTAAPTGKMNVTIRIRNTGYAPLYNERPVHLILRNQQSTVTIPLTADPRRWLPNGTVSAINEQVEIPADLSEGTYHLYLHLPDAYSALSGNAKYAIRLANEEVWDETTGYNDLGADVVISRQSPLDPGELPEVEIDDAIPTTMDSENAANKPHKIIENGILYIVMPNGKKYSCF